MECGRDGSSGAWAPGLCVGRGCGRWWEEHKGGRPGTKLANWRWRDNLGGAIVLSNGIRSVQLVLSVACCPRSSSFFSRDFCFLWCPCGEIATQESASAGVDTLHGRVAEAARRNHVLVRTVVLVPSIAWMTLYHCAPHVVVVLFFHDMYKDGPSWAGCARNNS